MLNSLVECSSQSENFEGKEQSLVNMPLLALLLLFAALLFIQFPDNPAQSRSIARCGSIQSTLLILSFVL